VERAFAICPECGEEVSLRSYTRHMARHIYGQSISERQVAEFKKMSHRQVVEYYAAHPEAIEKGMTIIFKELPIFRGKIDLVGRDLNQNICLIEVVHRSHYSRAHWGKKLRRYRSHLLTMATRLFKLRDVSMRLLIARPGLPPEEIK